MNIAKLDMNKLFENDSLPIFGVATVSFEGYTLEDKARGVVGDHRPQQFKPFRDGVTALIECEKGVILVCSEGVGTIVKENESTQIAGSEKKEGKENSRGLFPLCAVEATLEDLKACKSDDITTLDELIRDIPAESMAAGHRLNCNYRAILKGIRELGSDPTPYFGEAEYRRV